MCSALSFTIEIGPQDNWYTVDTCTGIDVPVLTGNFGTLAPPRIVRFVADDPDDLDAVYSAGDTLALGARRGLAIPREAVHSHVPRTTCHVPPFCCLPPASCFPLPASCSLLPAACLLPFASCSPLPAFCLRD